MYNVLCCLTMCRIAHFFMLERILKGVHNSNVVSVPMSCHLCPPRLPSRHLSYLPCIVDLNHVPALTTRHHHFCTFH